MHQGRRAGKGVGGRDAVSPNLVGTLFWEKAFYSPMGHLEAGLELQVAELVAEDVNV